MKKIDVYQKDDCERDDGEGESTEWDFEDLVGKLVDWTVVRDEVPLVLLQDDQSIEVGGEDDGRKHAEQTAQQVDRG